MKICPILQPHITIRNDLHNLAVAYIDQSDVDSEFAVEIGEGTRQGILRANFPSDSPSSYRIYAYICGRVFRLQRLHQPSPVCKTNVRILRELSSDDGGDAELQGPEDLLVLSV